MKAAFSAWLQRRWYSRAPVWFFTPLTGIFLLLSALRRGYLTRHATTLPVPVIIVGNIAVGGSGKTPFAVWLCRSLVEQGYKPGAIARGYGGNSSDWPILVHGDSDAALVGDEAVLLARRTGVPVAVGPDRVAAARLLMERATVDVIVSDDGLQHYGLSRDFEIIMVDAQRGLGNGWTLPAGPLREPVSRLSTAGLVVIKLAGPPAFAWPGAGRMALLPDAAVSLADGSRSDLRRFAGQKVHAVAAIADPSSFFTWLETLGMEVDGHPLPDHAPLTAKDLGFGDDWPVLMTEKDAVKCRGMDLDHHWYVEVSAHFDEPDRTNIMKRIGQVISHRSMNAPSD